MNLVFQREAEATDLGGLLVHGEFTDDFLRCGRRYWYGICCSLTLRARHGADRRR